MINRKAFIKGGLSLSTLGAMSSSPLGVLAKSMETRVTILHTNDWHSRIEPFPMDGGPNQGLGGAAARSALIQAIREESEHVLLLDAGDIFQGTPYYNYFGGELEFKLMTRMGYDCVTPGNHDFDGGIDGLLKQIPNAGFGFVNCNYEWNHPELKRQIQPYRIFTRGTIKIGVLGVGINLEGLVAEKSFGDIQYKDPVNSSNLAAEKLKTEMGCNLIICLSHLGYQYTNEQMSDIVLARNSRHIDLIIGGHTHTFLNKPDIQKNLDGKDVTINQSG